MQICTLLFCYAKNASAYRLYLIERRIYMFKEKIQKVIDWFKTGLRNSDIDTKWLIAGFVIACLAAWMLIHTMLKAFM